MDQGTSQNLLGAREIGLIQHHNIHRIEPLIVINAKQINMEIAVNQEHALDVGEWDIKQGSAWQHSSKVIQMLPVLIQHQMQVLSSLQLCKEKELEEERRSKGQLDHKQWSMLLLDKKLRSQMR